MTKKEFETVKVGDIVSIPNGDNEGKKYIVRYIEDESILGKYSEDLNGIKGIGCPEFRVTNYRAWGYY